MSRRAVRYRARVFGAWALLLPGAFAFQPVFGDLRGYLPGLIGITLGALVVLLAARLRFGPVMWFVTTLVAFVLAGGPLAAPETIVAGFVPSLETLRRLGRLTFEGWYDLLTVATPAGDLHGPQVAPLLSGLLFSLALVGVVRLTRAVVWPMILPVAWLALAIGFGVKQAPLALVLGAGLGVGIQAWGTAHRISQQGAANAQFLVRKPRGMSRRTWQAVAAAVVTALAVGSGTMVTGLSLDHVDRAVLRDHISPPLDLTEFPSPLTKYRLYSLKLKDEVLFSVSGVPAGARLRLAVMDQWNGEVFSVSQDTSEYVQVGREMPWQPTGDSAGSLISPQLYDDVWVPSFGEATRIEFAGENASEQARGLYFNRVAHQALTTARIQAGTAVDVSAVPVMQLTTTQREAIRDAGPGDAPLAEVSRVPEVLVQYATDWTASATSAYEALTMIEERLKTEGRYSDGSDNRSRAGHTAERLAYMFNQDQWIGDDEQYATAMALMATQRGIPARVVMGFYPTEPVAEGEVWQVTGTQAHVWVEACLDGAGWVSFDPTPDRDQTPDLENSQPKPKPKPRVETPPSPPEHLEDDTVTAEEEPVERVDKDDAASQWAALLATIAAVAGGLLLLLSPLLIITFIKVRRMWRRRTAGALTDQIAGAWEEVVDRARDMGFVARPEYTRGEAADQLQQHYPGLEFRPVAEQVDCLVYAPEEPLASSKDEVWKQAGLLRSSLLAGRPWYARPAALFSWRSLRRPKSAAQQPSSRATLRRKSGEPKT